MSSTDTQQATGTQVKEVQETIELRQDVGFAGPSYKRATLKLWNDGTVTWDSVVWDSHVGPGVDESTRIKPTMSEDLLSYP